MTIDSAALARAERALAAGLRGELRRDADLSRCTYYRIGGPADLLAEPEGIEDLRLLRAVAAEERLPLTVLGLGSNVLIDDAGIRGLTVRIGRRCGAVEVDGCELRAGAGATLAQLSALAARCGLRGLEFAVLIPGNLGGAIRMNAGARKQEIRGLVVRVRALDRSGSQHEFDRDACRFGYRDSRFAHEDLVVTEAALRLEPGEPKEILAAMAALREERRGKMPAHLPSAGATFKSPPGDFASRLIDTAGCKGMRVGGVQVSPMHANYFVNDGGATAAEVRELIRQVRDRVQEVHGVQLEREVVFLGGADGGDLPYDRPERA